jgi:DNA-binding protein H-NS
VDASRDVLQVEYQGQKGGDLILNMDSTATKDISPGKRAGTRGKQGETRSAAAQKTVSAKAPRKRRISKESAGASSDIVGDTPKPKRRGPGKKQKALAVKYRDPASDKTWSGRGRKPSWMRGDADQYLVSNLRVVNGGNPDAAEPRPQIRLKLKAGLKDHSGSMPGECKCSFSSIQRENERHIVAVLKNSIINILFNCKIRLNADAL